MSTKHKVTRPNQFLGAAAVAILVAATVGGCSEQAAVPVTNPTVPTASPADPDLHPQPQSVPASPQAATVGTAPSDSTLPTPPFPNTPPLKIGIKFTQPGIGLMVDGQPEGIDIDVALYIAEKLGYSPTDIEWVEALAPAREIMLYNGTVDMIVASYAFSQERAEAVDFAGPYLVTGQDVMVRADNNEINSVADLAGKRICSNAGYTGYVRIEAMLGGQADLTEGTRYVDCVEQLVAGEVDAVTTDDIILAGFAASDEYAGKVRLLGAPFSEELYSIGLPSGSTALCNRINDIIREMIADGTLAASIEQHTGESEFTPNPALNPPRTMLACN